jgi:hypothetical protein
MAQPRKSKPKQTIVPIKLEGTVYGAILNEDGKQIGEIPVCNVQVWEPKFGDLATLVAENWDGHIAQIEAHQAALEASD